VTDDQGGYFECAVPPGKYYFVELDYFGVIPGSDTLGMLGNQAGTVPALACERAIKNCSPFAPCPPDMVRMVGEHYREITFTFNYY
jgi:hypothetical protein